MRNFQNKYIAVCLNILATIFITIGYSSLYGQQRFSANFVENSNITVHGSTNINQFKLTINQTGIPVNRYSGSFIKNGSRILAVADSVAIPVKNFRSKDPLAYSGFMKLVNEKRNPYIFLKLNYLDLPSHSSSNTPVTINANGNITIAGKTKGYDFPLKLSQNKTGEYNIKGRIRLTIRDFGLEPPVEFFGLVKISEWVEIDLDTNILVSL